MLIKKMKLNKKGLNGMIVGVLTIVLVIASVTILWAFISLFLTTLGESENSDFANFLSLLSPKEEDNGGLKQDLDFDLNGACLIYNCSDSDSLIDFQNNETYLYGSVNVSNETFSYSFFDNCTNNSTLLEYYYTSESVFASQILCGGENSCINGACTVQQLPVCGDAICNATETCITCSQDCGLCVPECSDGNDNDADSYIDYPSDFGCQDINDNNETNDGTTQCSDGIDNDDDTMIDQADSYCTNRNNISEACIVTSWSGCSCTPSACSGCSGIRTSNCGTTQSCNRPATGCGAGKHCSGGQCVNDRPIG